MWRERRAAAVVAVVKLWANVFAQWQRVIELASRQILNVAGPLLLRRLSNPNGTAGFHVSRAVVSFFGFAFERRVFAAWLLFLWWPFRDRQLSSTHTESYNILLAAKRKSWIDTPPPTWPYCRPDGKMSKQLDDVFLSSPWDLERFGSPGYLNWWIWFLVFASPSDADVGNFGSRLEQKRLPWRKFDKRLVLFGRQQCHEWRKVWQRCHDVQVVFLPSFERLWKRSSRNDQLFFLPLKNTARLFKSCSRIVDFSCGQHWNELQSLGYRYTPPRLSITNAKNSYIFCLRSTIDKGLHLMTF